MWISARILAADDLKRKLLQVLPLMALKQLQHHFDRNLRITSRSGINDMNSNSVNYTYTTQQIRERKICRDFKKKHKNENKIKIILWVPCLQMGKWIPLMKGLTLFTQQIPFAHTNFGPTHADICQRDPTSTDIHAMWPYIHKQEIHFLSQE